MGANPGRLTVSPARTNLALLIRRGVRPTKGAHPLRNPTLAGSTPHPEEQTLEVFIQSPRAIVGLLVEQAWGGAGEWGRTTDLLITNQLLCH